jgi:hypothetical protein
MENKSMKIVYTVSERDNKSYWTRIGVAFTNRDGSINMKLDAVPLVGTLQLRDPEPRDDSRGRSGANDALFGQVAQA